MKGYILKGKDTSRSALEAQPRLDKVKKTPRGITLDQDVAQKWEASDKHREVIEVPVMEAREEVTYVFDEKEGDSFDDMFSR